MSAAQMSLPTMTASAQRQPALPPRVIPCPTCHVAAYMVLDGSQRGYSYHCSNPAHPAGRTATGQRTRRA